MPQFLLHGDKSFGYEEMEVDAWVKKCKIIKRRNTHLYIRENIIILARK